MLFLLFAAATLGLLIPFVYLGYKSSIKCLESKDTPDGYECPSIYDFKLTLISSIGFAAVEFAITKTLYPVVLPFCKEQKDLIIRDVRTTKAVDSVYKFIYFLASASFGTWILIDKPFYPVSLGGTGDLKLTMSKE